MLVDRLCTAPWLRVISTGSPLKSGLEWRNLVASVAYFPGSIVLLRLGSAPSKKIMDSYHQAV